MGKKKKYKKDLFDRDYSDISLEEQLKMSMFAEQLMNGEVVSVGFEDESPDGDEGESLDNYLEKILSPVFKGFSGANSPIVTAMIEVDSHTESELELYTDQIIEDCEVVKNDPVKSEPEVIAEYDNTPRVKPPVKTDYQRRQNLFEIYDDEDGEDEDDDVEGDDSDVEYTLDNQFGIIQADHSNGDIVIRDPWADFKGHTISFYNMITAKMDYDNSPVYQQMKGFINLAMAFIAGPILVIKQGNTKFKEFIKSVKEFDRERILVLSKMDNDAVDEDGSPAIHFLVYYIDPESKDHVETLFDTFENAVDENNEIALDFLYSVFGKAMDRHENPWCCYDTIDTLIEAYESSDEDVDFVVDLIKKDPDTVLGESNIDKFVEKFVMPIETFISDRFGSSNVFNTYVSLLGYVLDKSREDIKIVNDVIQVPINFGIEDKHSTKTNDEEDADDESDDMLDIEDSNGDDIDLPPSNNASVTKSNDSSLIYEAPKKKLGAPVSQNNSIKKFGSTPHEGGPMIIMK